RGVWRDIGAVHVAGDLNFFFCFALETFWVVLMTKLFGGVVAVLLKRLDLAGEAAEDREGLGEFFGRGGKLLARFGFDKKLGEMRRGELKADFGKLTGVILAQIFHQVFLEKPGINCAILFDTPFLVTAASFPVGD